MLRPESRQMSTRRVASGTPVLPQAEKSSPLPPKVPVPRVRTGTINPEPPSCLYSIRTESMRDSTTFKSCEMTKELCQIEPVNAQDVCANLSGFVLKPGLC